MEKMRWALAGLFASMVALAIAPMLMPASYSWIAQTTSESGAQGVPGAWLTRFGFVLFGVSVLVICVGRVRQWGAGATAAHTMFGLMMLVTAFASTRSWEANAAYDVVEDGIHSFAATAMGFAFAAGVVLVGLRRARNGGGFRVLDICVLIASIAIPLVMVAFGEIAGLSQRAMFLLAYVWYCREAVESRIVLARPPEVGSQQTQNL